MSILGFLGPDGPAPGLILRGQEATDREAWTFTSRVVAADALFSSHGSLVVVLKDLTHEEPNDGELLRMQKAVWNAGIAPVFFAATPSKVHVINGFARPAERLSDVILGSFPLTEDRSGQALIEQACGRLAFETGSFWVSSLGSRINRRTKVDAVLLQELARLERGLIEAGLPAYLAQKVIGRTIFSKYLSDRGILKPEVLENISRCCDVINALSTVQSARNLFRWIKTTFNGDLFASDIPNEDTLISEQHLKLCVSFLAGDNLDTGQRGLFPFQFDAIPVEVISSIYEQFAHSAAGGNAKRQGLHYTPLNLVELTLKDALNDVPADATVLDPTCGSGVFLVESFRRLVRARSKNDGISRGLVRQVLHEQIFGVDVNPAALQVAAFSLYLAAIDLDPDPNIHAADFRFSPLIGRTLRLSDILDPEVFSDRKFDIVIGNPPWTYTRKAASSHLDGLPPMPSRSPDWAFLWRAGALSKKGGRIALLMKATPFFSKASAGSAARKHLFENFSDIKLINMSQLRNEGLFPSVPNVAACPVPDLLGGRQFADEAESKRKANQAPTLLLSCKNDSPQDQSLVYVESIPWFPHFRRHGIINLRPPMGRNIKSAVAALDPAALKAAFFCNDREMAVLVRLTSSSRLLSFGHWLERHHLRAEQGFQIGGGDEQSASNLIGLPVLSAVDYRAVRMPKLLRSFNWSTVHRPRNERIYRAPLVLLPEASFTKSLESGRYSSVFSPFDCAFTDSFVGISFPASAERLARALSVLFNSKIVAFQLAFGSSNVGIKQPKIERSDLLSLQVPDLARVSAPLIDELLELEDLLGKRQRIPALLRRLDEISYSIWGLDPEDAIVIDGALDRSRSMFLDTNGARQVTVESVTAPELALYTAVFISTLDQVLARNSYHRAGSVDAIRFGTGLLALRTRLSNGGRHARDGLVVKDPELFDIGTLNGVYRNSSYALITREIRQGVREGEIYVLKPVERRLWSGSDAQADAVAAVENPAVQSFLKDDKPLSFFH